ncbi:MAG: hypothetical protein A2V70_03825 [Planctomycetes bacterium RBG_13_63_9]|nr:MAG: hypothetical protein A2V70_03825 [Planctomycetes bacterium RBG_13_63_9]
MFRLASRYVGLTAMNLRSMMPQHESFMLWVDAVGGFWVCLADEVTLGQPVCRGTVDVPILGDISSRHARIRRDGEAYLIEAIRDVHVNGRPVERVASLTDGSRVALGQSVRLAFRRPHPLSATARLDIVSHHHTQPSSDAVLLMADSCILGPDPRSHVVCRDWKQEVILYRHDGSLHCRTTGSLEIDGVCHQRHGQMTRSSHVVGNGFSLSLEEIKP